MFAGTPEFSVPALEALIEMMPKGDVFMEERRDLDEGSAEGRMPVSEMNTSLLERLKIIAVYTRPDKAAGRGKHLQESPVKQCAKKHNIPVYQPTSLRKSEVQEELAALKPDVIIVAAYGCIFPQEVLDIPRFGCLNIHASLLPRWRGAAPIQQAILEGDSKTGISLMQMEAGLDTGPVYAMESCDITAEETAQTLHDKLAGLGAKTLTENLPAILKGEIKPQAQNDALATHVGKITKQSGRINWQKTALEIERQVRAYNPWPVAYFYMNEEYVRVWEASALVEKTSLAPGTIVRVHSEGIDIAAGEQSLLRLRRLQLANAKAMSVKEYLNAPKHIFTEGNLSS